MAALISDNKKGVWWDGGGNLSGIGDLSKTCQALACRGHAFVYPELEAMVFKARNSLVTQGMTAAYKDLGNVPSIIKGHVYKVNYLNANETATCNGENKLAYYNNYFKGKNQTKWAQNVSGYKAIHYNNLYDNIDLKVYSASKYMKSDYIVKVGGEPKSIKLQYEGVDGISLEENGRLKVLTSINTIFEMKPYAYQIINGKEVEVACDFVLVDDIVSFNLPNGYDKSVELVIDPTLVFSTYSGSPSDNWGSSSTHDNLGNMFLGGISLGPDYPTTTGAFQTDFAGG